MEEIKLNITSEYGQLRSAIVNTGEEMVPKEELNHIEKEFGTQNWSDEIKDHPEAAPWSVPLAKFEHAMYLFCLRTANVELYYAPSIPRAAQQIFTRDVGVVVGDTFYATILGDGIRRIEKQGIEVFRDRFTNYAELTEGVVEGGDIFVHGKKVFIGITKNSTNWEGFKGLQKRLEPKGFECVPVRCAASVLHLDCRFNILAEKEAVIYRGDIHKDDVTLLEQDFHLTSLPESETKMTLASNFLMLSPQMAIAEINNKKAAGILQEKGIQPTLLYYKEIMKQWGAFRCTTLPLYRTP